MDFPPDEWIIFPAADFLTASLRFPGEWGVEIMAQVRSNGRICDHWRVALGGSKVLEAIFPISCLLPAATNLPPWELTYQQFPRDIVIRRNMLTSVWYDALNLLAAHEILIADEAGQPVDTQQVLQAVKNLPAKQNTGASLRWALAVSNAFKLELQLQCLPSPANQLTGKPIFNRYNSYLF